MSPSHPDTAFRSKRPTARDLSAPHLRALRKELLLVRADVERMELAQATVDLRQAVSHFSWLKFIVPGFAGGMPWGRRRGAAAGIGALLKEYPLISSIVSLVLAKPIRATVFGAAKPVLKWPPSNCYRGARMPRLGGRSRLGARPGPEPWRSYSRGWSRTRSPALAQTRSLQVHPSL